MSFTGSGEMLRQYPPEISRCSIHHCWTSLAFALALALDQPADWETKEILVPEIKKILKQCPIEKHIIIHLFILKQSAFYSLPNQEDKAQ